MTKTTRQGLWAVVGCFGLLLVTVVPVRAKVLTWQGRPDKPGFTYEVSPRVGLMSGSTSYRIGGDFSGPDGSGYSLDRLSELKFPLGVEMLWLGAGARYNLPYGDKFRRTRYGGAIVVEGEYGRNFTRNAGKMEDSDWTEPYFPNLRTIYSTSDATLIAENLELLVRVNPLEVKGAFFGWRLGLGAGYLRQRYDYDISNVVQWSIYPEYNGSFKGKALTYEVTYGIPYAEIATGITFGQGDPVSGSLDARVGYSSWAHASDRDDHLLRSKVATGKADGDALILRLRGRVTFLRYLFVTLGVTSVSIDTSGAQTQRRYAENDEGPAGLIGTIDTKIFSDQTVFDLSVGATF